MGILANENSIGGGNYLISNSLRFQSASSQYLSRTFGTATSTTTWTWSGWVKRGALSSYQRIFSTTAATSQFFLRFNNTDTLLCETASSSVVLNTTQVFRDPSAWYHIVFTWDTTNATASDRVRLYINGTRITAFATINNPALNATSSWNTAVAHYLGGATTTEPLDGYLAEVNFIDGQALTPSSFGETDALTGVWIAKKYTGTYGTNGFYLPFSNGTSTTTLGNDSSGNANNWTLTNFTRSAGVSDCWMYDVPSGNGGVSATQPSSNYATLNPLAKVNTPATISNGNLNGSGTDANAIGNVAVTSGKWYAECIYSTVKAGDNIVGVQSLHVFATSASPSIMRTTGSVGYDSLGGTSSKGIDNVFTSYGSSWTANDIIGIALDLDNNQITFYKNNVSQGTISYTFSNYGPWVFANGAGSTPASLTFNWNFGQRSFAYTPPSGFKALCTANLPTPTIAKGNQYMDATLYTGNATARSITNEGAFSPDFVWIKGRSGATDHALYDAVRGTTLDLVSNSTAAETTQAQGVTAFNSNGFSIGTLAKLNTNTATYVAWQWDAGSSTVTNTSGSISSQVRANPTAGFSIVAYTGTGANATVGHGLGVAPKMVIVKTRGTAGFNWVVYHSSLLTTEFLQLNLADAKVTSAPTVWNSTAPAASVFSIGTATGVNTNTNTYIAYCFAEVPGFSKFGSYTGNGSTDGPFVYCGFRPKFVMIKAVAGTFANGTWVIKDTSRNPYNVTDANLYANLSNAEDATSTVYTDILSNGFKLRGTYDGVNGSAVTYIYMAFAENPFNYSNAR